MSSKKGAKGGLGRTPKPKAPRVLKEYEQGLQRSRILGGPML